MVISDCWIRLLLFGLLAWLIFNIVWLAPKFDLINQYKQLMRLLKKHDKSQEIERIISGWNPNSPQSHVLAIQYFSSKRVDINRKFIELSKKINSSSRLLYPNTALIGKEFAELFIDIKELYNYFSVPIDSEFISALKESRNNFTEIAEAVSEDLLPLPDSRSPYSSGGFGSGGF